ncbi:hypothetical protein C8J56DRAFT_1104621 [Mycena floridula]|nr:hypothetical protein C8J56DRAFT_1104621 [Mycena floridula]
MSVQNFPAELLREFVSLLVDDDEYEYNGYPDSLYHQASMDILSLSTVNHQFRSICSPFLFSYIHCKSLNELESLEYECSAKSAFTGFIRTLDIDPFLEVGDNFHTRGSALLVRLLVYLDSLAWLKLRDGRLIEASVVTSINAHPTLETVAVSEYSQIQTFLEAVGKTVPLDKFLIHKFGLDKDNSRCLSLFEEHNIRLASLFFCGNAPLSRIETRLLQCDLRELSIYDHLQISADQFHAFVALHPTLTRINIYDVNALGWHESTLSKQHITSFRNAAEEESLGPNIMQFSISLSPSTSTPAAGFDGWEVTRLDFGSVFSPIETLSLAGTVFPKVTSLSITLVNREDPINIKALVALIFKYFPNLRAFGLHPASGLLTWTPQQIPTFVEFPGEPVELEDAAACLRTIAWHMFQASSLLATIEVSNYDRRPRHELVTWSYQALYKAQRNPTHAIVKLKIQSNVHIYRRPESGGRISRYLHFKGSVIL